MNEGWQDTNLFLRQVHPNHFDGVNPNSVAFSPTPKDDDKLSVDDETKASPQDSWNHFTKTLGYQSVGTWAVTLAEVKEAELQIVSDPLVNNPAHCAIDYSVLSTKGQKKKRAQQLAIRASQRGCLFKASA
jgi:hypothetical protein